MSLADCVPGRTLEIGQDITFIKQEETAMEKDNSRSKEEILAIKPDFQKKVMA